MIRFEIAERYARALFLLSAPQKKKEAWSAILTTLVELWKKVPDLKCFLSHPEVTLDQKKKLLEKLCDEAEVVNLLIIVLIKGKMQFLPEIASKYAHLVAASSGTLYGEMLSSRPVDVALSAFIEEQLAKKTGKQVKMIFTHQPALLGGAQIVLQNQLADFSIKTRLERLEKSLLKNRYA